MKTRPDWEKEKQLTLKFIQENSGKFNGVDIDTALQHDSINNLKIINGKYMGYFGELEQENKIKYDYKEEKWYAITTIDSFC